MRHDRKSVKSRRGGRALRWSAVLLALLLVLATGMLVFLVADHHHGRFAAIGSLVALVVGPLLFGVSVEKAAGWRGREARAEVVALVAAPVLYVAALVVAFTVLRRPVAQTLVSLGDRYAWATGWVGSAGARLGKALDPSVPTPKLKPSLAPSAMASATTSVVVTETGVSATFTSTVVTHSAMVLTAAPTVQPSRPGRFMAFPGDLTKEELGGCVVLSDVASIRSAYEPSKLRAAAEALATKRYPLGVEFLRAQDDKQLFTWFEHGGATFDDLASSFDTAVHEGAHIWGFKRFSPRTQTYGVSADVTLTLPRLSNFDRSEILKVHVSPATDDYAKIYLTGKSGAQGFNMLLDEYNAYVHSLASRYCTRDLLPDNLHVSARDGILTFMYYVETYLQLARTQHPKDYRAIVEDAAHRQLILGVWARAEYWLRKSATDVRLGITDETIEGWVYDASRLAEIAAVRDAGLK